MSILSLVLASSNEGKLAELRALLAELPVQVLSTAEALGEPLLVPEDGISFQENASAKALAASKATGLVALGDDSGLEVEALDGRPGVRSARFAREHATDAENNAALLRELEEVPEPQRGARFRCVLSLVTPWGKEPLIAEGSCAGAIARTPRGSGGFGYDPLFVLEGTDGRAMAELSEDEKNRVSHRARAMRALLPLLTRVLEECLTQTERVTREWAQRRST